MKHVLITGAAGLIGTGLREQFAGRYRLRLTDVRTPPALGEDEAFVEVDLRDSEAVQGVVEGVDAVVHLGGIASEDTWEAIRDVNIDGTYNVFESARRSGVKRVVYASSVHAVGFTIRAWLSLNASPHRQGSPHRSSPRSAGPISRPPDTVILGYRAFRDRWTDWSKCGQEAPRISCVGLPFGSLRRFAQADARENPNPMRPEVL